VVLREVQTDAAHGQLQMSLALALAMRDQMRTCRSFFWALSLFSINLVNDVYRAARCLNSFAEVWDLLLEQESAAEVHELTAYFLDVA